MKLNAQLFNARELGASLAEVALDVIKTESQDVVSRWYHSEKDADLFIWQDQRKNIIKQQVSFCGLVVEWNIIEGIKTGHIVEDEQRQRTSGSDVIHFDQLTEKVSLKQAIEVVSHAEALGDIERRKLVRNFVEAPKMADMDPQHFLKYYGQPKASSGFMGPFRRLLRRFYRLLISRN